MSVNDGAPDLKQRHLVSEEQPGFLAQAHPIERASPLVNEFRINTLRESTQYWASL
jgi:hypothetical protein